MQMNGVGGKAGWSWIFIIEGLLTFVVALGAFYFMQDYPDTAGFLTKVERREVKRRLENDRDFLADEYNTKFIWQALTDWKVYVLAIASGCLALPTYCVSLFLPTIVKELGYKNTTAQLMSTPPYLVACFVCIAGTSSDQTLNQQGLTSHRRLCRRQTENPWSFHDRIHSRGVSTPLLPTFLFEKILINS